MVYIYSYIYIWFINIIWKPVLKLQGLVSLRERLQEPPRFHRKNMAKQTWFPVKIFPNKLMNSVRPMSFYCLWWFCTNHPRVTFHAVVPLGSSVPVTSECIHAHIHTYIHACMHACIHTHTHIYIYIYIHVDVYITYTHACITIVIGVISQLIRLITMLIIPTCNLCAPLRWCST